MNTPHLLTASPLSLNTPRPRAYSSPSEGLGKCSTMAELRQYHSQIIRLGLSADNDTMGRVIKFCSLSESGNLVYAIKVFDTIPEPDAFIYNIIMRGYLQHQLPRNCFLLYAQMLQDSVLPNDFTFPPVIKACCLNDDIEQGKQIHAHVFKLGYAADRICLNSLINMYSKLKALGEAKRVFDSTVEKDFVSWTSLISGYSQWGFLDEAFQVFQLMPERNSASWNAMIAAYVQSNRFHEAFSLFDRMRAEKIVMDKFVAASMLSACTSLGALEQGKWIHKHIEQNGIEMDSKLSTSIVHMYCRCGCLEKALEVFDGLPCKGISLWNCMIGGLAMHGKGEAAMELFKELQRKTIIPDNITFVNLLTACAHSGLVEEGRRFFRDMTEVYGIQPRTEHFGCMVDLLGRAGMLEEARRLINEMPMKPDATVLGALFAACKNHRNLELGEEVGKRVIELEPDNSGRYVLLANLYAGAGKWEDVAVVRKMMNDKGVNKVPGFSVIEVEGTVNEFVAGERDHPQAKEIYAKVDEMLECITTIGYVLDIDGVMQGLDEEIENSSYHHSEKLAVAFGLLKTQPGATLRITKNLRICEDCHHAMKHISKVFDRNIIVRDRQRFHHFKMGECSCKDYW